MRWRMWGWRMGSESRCGNVCSLGRIFEWSLCHGSVSPLSGFTRRLSALERVLREDAAQFQVFRASKNSPATSGSRHLAAREIKLYATNDDEATTYTMTHLQRLEIEEEA